MTGHRLIQGAALAIVTGMGTGIVCALGCASSPSQCEALDRVESAIKYESRDAGIAPIPASRSIVAVYVEVDDFSEPRFACTATRIGDRSYLTARHCLPEVATSAPPAPVVFLSATSRSASSNCDHDIVLLPVARVTAHATLDLALLVTDQDPLVDEPPDFMRLSRAFPKLSDALVIAGYGLTESGSKESLRSLHAEVVELGAHEITVQGLGGGACVGDSGGPLYVTDDSNVTTLFGVLSKGSASCLGRDVYVDVSGAGDWITQRLGNSP